MLSGHHKNVPVSPLFGMHSLLLQFQLVTLTSDHATSQTMRCASIEPDLEMGGECASGYYGVKCEQFCVSAMTCNGRGYCARDGSCACLPGFAGVHCDECHDGFYGKNCEARCKTKLTCGGVGRCTGNADCACQEGLTGDACDTCEAGRFGASCNVSVAADDLESFLIDNQICSGNFQDNCQDCLPNFFGEVCAYFFFDCGRVLFGSILLSLPS